jgi:transcriptional regulator with XRE-family HTH domain
MVIQAQLKPKRVSGTQRRDVRRTMQLVAPGKTAKGQFAEVLIHDLSTGGLLVQTDAPLAVGEALEVVLPRTGVRQAEVIWTSGSYFGCRFVQPVPPASVSAALLMSAPMLASASGDRGGLAPIEFGDRLTALRVAKGWALEKLAERLGVSRQAVWYWETGQRLPRAEHFRKIAGVFAVPEADLLVQQPPALPGGHTALISELRREIARHNGVDEAEVKIVIQF